jgi:glutathionylspermidine synthase
MWRHASRPREGWRGKVESQGLIFPVTTHADGSETPYWNEAAWYEFTLDEVEVMEAATEELWRMSLEAVRKMAVDLDDARLGLPAGSLDYVRESLRRGDPSVYGRFDLWYDGSTPKLLELNGDTPTGLVESAVAQWHWLSDVLPESDQWNSVHDRLVARWKHLMDSGALPGNEIHFFHSRVDTTGEEEMTTVYLRDTAAMAGLATFGHHIEEVQWDSFQMRFLDAMGRPIRNAFKLYPWEDMLREEFGGLLLQRAESEPVRWIEPVWKVLLSTKALLPVLWEMYPDHPNLLPSYFDEPRDLLEWVAKPLHGREGDNIRVHLADGSETVQPGGYGAEGYVYQEWCPLPSFDGNRAMIGSWVVDGEAAGMIVRESDGPITDYYSRVAPHAITDTLAPDQAQVQAWLAERTGPSAPKPPEA